MRSNSPLTIIALFSVFLFAAACSPRQMPPPAPVLQESTQVIDIPETEREMRAVWIATVANIDWPSKAGLSTEEQKRELRAMFDRIQMLNLNTVIFQVRPANDAFYQSDLEPWSEYLTGKQGRAPEPFYDPLEFAINEAHKRGLELHAWINPFRAKHSSGDTLLADNHISKTHSHLIREYGRFLWMDPGDPESHEWSLNVVRDIVERYDVDAIHIDDYFYPYREYDDNGQRIEFPDSATYGRYVEEYGEIDRNDWRRQNVDRFVENLHDVIKEADPTVRFGISPFGLWRPDKQGPQFNGFNAYEELFADSRKWFNEGWLDYFTPQLYWPSEQIGQRYEDLIYWWDNENLAGRHFWPGNFTSRVGVGDILWPADEISNQIAMTRAFPGATGNMHFSMRVLMMNPGGLLDEMGRLYESPALVPATDWLGDIPPHAPDAELLYINEKPFLEFQPVGEEPVWLYVVKKRYGNQWITEVVPGWKQHLPLLAHREGEVLATVSISAVNKLGLESQPVIFLGEQIANRR